MNGEFILEVDLFILSAVQSQVFQEFKAAGYLSNGNPIFQVMDLCLMREDIPMELRFLVKEYLYHPMNDCAFFLKRYIRLAQKTPSRSLHAYLKLILFMGTIEYLDVSRITSFACLFEGATIYWDLSRWDTSNVTNMSSAFSRCIFHPGVDCGIQRWNVSKVTNMSGMFCFSQGFNSPVGQWDVSQVTVMRLMFHGCYSFNQNLNAWNTARVQAMDRMFSHCESYNQPMNRWNVAAVTTFNSMFQGAKSFNQSLDVWGTVGASDRRSMFEGCQKLKQAFPSWFAIQPTQTRNQVMDLFKDCPLMRIKPHLITWEMFREELPTETEESRVLLGLAKLRKRRRVA